jgi:glycosyltransferase involved in cell wall biosynthesis
MIRVSCFAKLHAFNLAEQLNSFDMLSKFYTSFYSQKNSFFSNFHRRVDREIIPFSLTETNISLAILRNLFGKEYFINHHFDLWVKHNLVRDNDYKILIGWSGMSLNSIREAKKNKKVVILERGSTHIEYQNKILNEEYKSFDIHFNIDSRVIKKELQEYKEVDFISIPSSFVRNTFLEYGVDKNKLIVNPYGVSSYFKKSEFVRCSNKFRILYLGAISIRKGFKYFYESIQHLDLPPNSYELCVIGSITTEMNKYLMTVDYKKIKFL